MLDQGRLITEAVSILVIGDRDNGFGNAINVKRTFKGFIKTGFVGILLEDQVRIYQKSHENRQKQASRHEHGEREQNRAKPGKATSSMEKHTRGVGFALDPLTKEAQAVIIKE
ncbi:phosphoenolpyruvate carboxylase family protein [Tanacetum coccineum]